MLLEIIKYPDPRLARKSEEVTEVTDEIKALVENMLETMYEAEGVGLAAPQVGRNLRLIVMDPFHHDGERKPRAFLNPVLEYSGEIITSENEGCLSVPLNYRADVPRYSTVRLMARDLAGNEVDEILEGFPAIVVQHETDHLDGTLFIDKISHLRRNMYDGRIKKWRKTNA